MTEQQMRAQHWRYERMMEKMEENRQNTPSKKRSFPLVIFVKENGIKHPIYRSEE